MSTPVSENERLVRRVEEMVNEQDTDVLRDVFAEDDMVAARYTGRGTHEGEHNGIAPAGEAVGLSGMRMARVADDEIVEVRGQRNDLGLLAHLDAVELPEP